MKVSKLNNNIITFCNLIFKIGYYSQNIWYQNSSQISSLPCPGDVMTIFWAAKIINGCCYIRHLAVGYLPCYSLLSLPTSESVCPSVPLFWFWSSFLVYCLSCQAPLHSINATLCFSMGWKLKQIKLKKSRCIMAFPKLGCCLKNQELYSQQTVKYLHVCRNSKKVLGYLNIS